jgi:hypothetical protein
LRPPKGQIKKPIFQQFGHFGLGHLEFVTAEPSTVIQVAIELLIPLQDLLDCHMVDSLTHSDRPVGLGGLEHAEDLVLLVKDQVGGHPGTEQGARELGFFLNGSLILSESIANGSLKDLGKS